MSCNVRASLSNGDTPTKGFLFCFLTPGCNVDTLHLEDVNQSGSYFSLCFLYSSYSSEVTALPVAVPQSHSYSFSVSKWTSAYKGNTNYFESVCNDIQRKGQRKIKAGLRVELLNPQQFVQTGQHKVQQPCQADDVYFKMLRALRGQLPLSDLRRHKATLGHATGLHNMTA